MVQYQSIDRTFAALADPARGQSSAMIAEPAEPDGITLTGMKKRVQLQGPVSSRQRRSADRLVAASSPSRSRTSRSGSS
jgi:hypothetical protein